MKKTKIVNRCSWAGPDPAYVEYHDREWGVPVFNDRKLFEFLILEGAQAGLSWLTILKRREGYRKAFQNFDPAMGAVFTQQKTQSLMHDAGIIRHRLKIESAVNNAREFLKVQEEFGSFSKYQWRFVDGVPIRNHWENISQLPATTKLSDSLSRDLKSRGFTFVGPTIIYAYMQAVGMVDDHLTCCFRHGDRAITTTYD